MKLLKWRETAKTSTFVLLGLFGLALAVPLVLRAGVQDLQLGPLVELSWPNAVGSCNTGFTPFAGLTWSTDHALEAFVAVNPINPGNVAAAWYQGLFQDMIAGASFDGGFSWQHVLMPLTTCSGGAYIATGDPWLSFTPNGDLYAVALTWNSSSWSDREIVVSKSADGGVHWSAPLVIPGSHTVDPPADHPTITADPTDPQFVYAIWNGNSSPHSGPAVFTRTIDGGVTWETARAIVQTAEQSFIQQSQILVLPDGTLVDIFEFYEEQPNKPVTFANLQLMRSNDRGQTWSAPTNAVTMTPLYRPNGLTLVVDPNTGQFVHDIENPSFGMATFMPSGRTGAFPIFNTTTVPSRCRQMAVRPGPHQSA